LHRFHGRKPNGGWKDLGRSADEPRGVEKSTKPNPRSAASRYMTRRPLGRRRAAAFGNTL
jgi:hypothetical protein